MNTVLIIDDSEINLTLLKHLVIKLGDCSPVLYDSPIKALEWCRSNVPDLVIVDYMMPDMDGLEFIDAFRALHSRDEIPVLMITANDQREVRYKALLGGANDFLAKPIDRNEFSARMKNMLALEAPWFAPPPRVRSPSAATSSRSPAVPSRPGTTSVSCPTSSPPPRRRTARGRCRPARTRAPRAACSTPTSTAPSARKAPRTPRTRPSTPRARRSSGHSASRSTPRRW